MLALDHCGCVVQSLDAGAARWARLGFSVTPRSRQRGAVPGHADMQPWATANHCVMLQRGYLELIGVVDPGGHNPWSQFLARGEGLHIAALRCDDADAAYAALAARTGCFRPPVQRERPLDVAGELRTARFRNIFSDDAQCPEARYIVIEHQTPEFLWQPRYLEHENGALSLDETTFIADDPAVLLPHLQLFGPVRSDADGSLRVTLDGRGMLGVMRTDTFAKTYGYAPAYRPGLHVLTVGVRDLPQAVALVQSRGVAVRSSDAGYWVPPDETGGFVLRLAASDARA
jgi:hypothetical protein